MTSRTRYIHIPKGLIYNPHVSILIPYYYWHPSTVQVDQRVYQWVKCLKKSEKNDIPSLILLNNAFLSPTQQHFLRKSAIYNYLLEIAQKII